MSFLSSQSDRVADVESADLADRQRTPAESAGSTYREGNI